MSAETTFHGRHAVSLENNDLRVTVLVEGGHIAEIFDKRAGVSPLWVPPWPSIEHSQFDPARHDRYGTAIDAGLLAGIMGHNLCLDIFGAPSASEAAAGMPVHGEASNVRYDATVSGTEIVMRAALPLAALRVERCIELRGEALRIRETVENTGGTDRPVGWTQHVTLGSPFLARGETEFRASATRSLAFEGAFGVDDYLEPSATFEWPHAPRKGGGIADLRVFTAAPRSSAYTAHLMDPAREFGWFVAFAPAFQLAFGYIWRCADFPWLGIWEENMSRTAAPWNGETITRGMEFGVSPFPESRQAMVERGRLFDTPTFKWIPAASRVGVEYWCVSRPARAVPETLDRPT